MNTPEDEALTHLIERMRASRHTSPADNRSNASFGRGDPVDDSALPDETATQIDSILGAFIPAHASYNDYRLYVLKRIDESHLADADPKSDQVRIAAVLDGIYDKRPRFRPRATFSAVQELRERLQEYADLKTGVRSDFPPVERLAHRTDDPILGLADPGAAAAHPISQAKKNDNLRHIDGVLDEWIPEGAYYNWPRQAVVDHVLASGDVYEINNTIRRWSRALEETGPVMRLPAGAAVEIGRLIENARSRSGRAMSSTPPIPDVIRGSVRRDPPQRQSVNREANQLAAQIVASVARIIPSKDGNFVAQLRFIRMVSANRIGLAEPGGIERVRTILNFQSQQKLLDEHAEEISELAHTFVDYYRAWGRAIHRPRQRTQTAADGPEAAAEVKTVSDDNATATGPASLPRRQASLPPPIGPSPALVKPGTAPGQPRLQQFWTRRPQRERTEPGSIDGQSEAVSEPTATLAPNVPPDRNSAKSTGGDRGLKRSSISNPKAAGTVSSDASKRRRLNESSVRTPTSIGSGSESSELDYVPLTYYVDEPVSEPQGSSQLAPASKRWPPTTDLGLYSHDFRPSMDYYKAILRKIGLSDKLVYKIPPERFDRLPNPDFWPFMAEVDDEHFGSRDWKLFEKSGACIQTNFDNENKRRVYMELDRDKYLKLTIDEKKFLRISRAHSKAAVRDDIGEVKRIFSKLGLHEEMASKLRGDLPLLAVKSEKAFRDNPEVLLPARGRECLVIDYEEFSQPTFVRLDNYQSTQVTEQERRYLGLVPSWAQRAPTENQDQLGLLPQPRDDDYWEKWTLYKSGWRGKKPDAEKSARHHRESGVVGGPAIDSSTPPANATTYRHAAERQGTDSPGRKAHDASQRMLEDRLHMRSSR